MNGVKMREPIEGRVFLIYNTMEFYSEKTMFTMGQGSGEEAATAGRRSRHRHEELKDGVRADLMPAAAAPVVHLPSLVAAAACEVVPERTGLIWDVRASQVAALNLDASMTAFHAYLATVGKPMSEDNWKWAPGLSADMCGRLNRFQESAAITWDLAERGKSSMQAKSTGRNNRRYDPYGNADKVLLCVVAADTPEPIIRETRKWPDFSVDEGGLRQAMTGPNTLAVAVRCNVTVEKWCSVGNGVADSFVSLNSVYTGSLLQLSPLEGNGVTVSRDAFGFMSVSYTMKVSNYTVTVRITDVTHAPTGVDDLGEVPPYDRLIESHCKETEWVPETSYAGAQFNSFHMDVEKSVRHCLGAENGLWQVTAVQAGGHVKINGDCPLNLDVKSVVVFRDRGWKTTPESVGEYLDFSHQKEGHFVNLVEVDIADIYESSRVVRVFDGLFDETMARGNDT